MELQGKVIIMSDIRSGVSKTTGNPWAAQDFVIETHEQFPKRMMFTVFGEDKLKQFNIQMGEEINVFFDINAREYNGKYYNDIRAWRIDRVDPNNPMPQQPTAYPQQPGAQPFPPQQTTAAPAYPQQPVGQQPFPPQQPAAPAYPQQPAQAGGFPQQGQSADFSQQGDDENLPF